MLTDTKTRQCKAEGKPFVLSDSGGLWGNN